MTQQQCTILRYNWESPTGKCRKYSTNVKSPAAVWIPGCPGKKGTGGCRLWWQCFNSPCKESCTGNPRCFWLPTDSPTKWRSLSPTPAPTQKPTTAKPTRRPTVKPGTKPTAPTKFPTRKPTQPTNSPTQKVTTRAPTTAYPTLQPTQYDERCFYWADPVATDAPTGEY